MNTIREKSLILILLLLFLAATGNVFAQDRVENSADQFNFMIGDWDISAKIKNSPNSYIEGKGTMNVSRSGDTILAMMDVKFENFTVLGTTKREFDKKTRRWKIGWYPVGQAATPDIDGLMLKDRFIELNYGTDQNGGFVGRLVIYEIKTDRFLVRKDRLYDNGKFMPEIWTYEATRSKPDSAN